MRSVGLTGYVAVDFASVIVVRFGLFEFVRVVCLLFHFPTLFDTDEAPFGARFACPDRLAIDDHKERVRVAGRHHAQSHPTTAGNVRVEGEFVGVWGDLDNKGASVGCGSEDDAHLSVSLIKTIKKLFGILFLVLFIMVRWLL